MKPGMRTTGALGWLVVLDDASVDDDDDAAPFPMATSRLEGSSRNLNKKHGDVVD
jgi:hypothetical protein